MPKPNSAPETACSMGGTSSQARPAAPTCPLGAGHPIAQAAQPFRHH
ncbi:hypothetical protein ACGFNX_31580 [Streptomyces sp. NPDC048723]